MILFAMTGAGMGFWLGTETNLRGAASNHLSAVPGGSVGTVAASGVASTGSAVALDDLARRINEMQAALVRINALGERLVEISGLDPAEFSFDALPGQGGGPEEAARDYTIKELAGELSSMVSLVETRHRSLDVLQQSVVKKALAVEKGVPAGWPVKTGYVSSKYGFRIHPIKGTRSFHEGIDLAAPTGTPIYAVADGEVSFSGWMNGYGRIVEIRHANGVSTRYAHNSKNLVKQGQVVRRGQQIAAVGSTGRSTGPHVHFEVRRNGDAVNPAPYLARQPKRLVAQQSDDINGWTALPAKRR